MKVIIAKINESKWPDISFVTRMLRVCSDIGISPPAYVRTVEGLFDTLKNFKKQDLILFTNFPSDDSYLPNRGQKDSLSGEHSLNQKDELNTYSQSINLFAKIGVSRTFSEIHFFTCASASIISDEFFNLLAPGSPVKVNRIEKGLIKSADYDAAFKEYISDRVKGLVLQCQ